MATSRLFLNSRIEAKNVAAARAAAARAAAAHAARAPRRRPHRVRAAGASQRRPLRPLRRDAAARRRPGDRPKQRHDLRARHAVPLLRAPRRPDEAARRLRRRRRVLERRDVRAQRHLPAGGAAARGGARRHAVGVAPRDLRARRPGVALLQPLARLRLVLHRRPPRRRHHREGPPRPRRPPPPRRAQRARGAHVGRRALRRHGAAGDGRRHVGRRVRRRAAHAAPRARLCERDGPRARGFGLRRAPRRRLRRGI